MLITKLNNMEHLILVARLQLYTKNSKGMLLPSNALPANVKLKKSACFTDDLDHRIVFLFTGYLDHVSEKCSF